MKYLPITFLNLFLIFASCDNTNDNLNTSSVDQKEGKILERTLFGETKNEEVKDIMYMTSYLIARTLLEDEDAQQQFYQLGSGKSLKIDLKTLLTSKSTFEQAFKLRYKRYNWSTPPKGEPTPPISQAVPDPLEKDYDVLTIPYIGYIDLIQNTFDWIVSLPNKEKLYQYDSFKDYIHDNDTILNLWSFDTSNYSDGLKTHYNGGSFIPTPFDYNSALETTFMMTLKNK
ncbi:hypothetical protein SAMN04489761_2926 [Tenacibaculum sp. MAR_2009_124]|uniref:hypothetical protein n=1 Tax=Tenacibaculum sp. MAR_2009_124 TaxID=1250059 RepID=UPI0008947B81|nr:hypothetical protein [Tenacibaculum sp. MAR_2009_124]SEC41385.1 hypothetical protein SAMN04489761_2926 [Tenacibaculum sp. MAR_2009_124]